MITIQQQESYNKERTIKIVRESVPEWYGTIWFVVGELADWVGFQDDYGDFIPVDWC
jgi:hypothetical protein